MMNASRKVQETRISSQGKVTLVDTITQSVTVMFNVDNEVARYDESVVLLVYPTVVSGTATVTIKYTPVDKYGKPYNGAESILVSNLSYTTLTEGTDGPLYYALTLPKCWGVQITFDHSTASAGTGEMNYRVLF